MTLFFSISNSVTQEDWEKVYEETLFLADKLDLADWGKFFYKGVRHYAYCKVKERTEVEFGEKKLFWQSCSEYYNISGRNYFRLNRVLNNKYNENAGPAILRCIDSYTNLNSECLKNQTNYDYCEIWGGNYYIKVLAILCLLEGRLKEKVFIYGEVGKEDFEAAVRIANRYLKEPIEVSARCDYKRMYEIVKTIDIPDEEKLNLMENAYLGEIDLNYKTFIESKFDKTAIKRFWENKFKDFDVKDDESKDAIKSYLAHGFDFKDLFTYIPLARTKEECLKLLELTIETAHSNCYFNELELTRDPKDDRVRYLPPEFIRSLFGADSKITIGNYTFEDLVNELSKYFGEQIDVRNFLKGKIKDEDEEAHISSLKEVSAKNDDSCYSKEERKCDIFRYGQIIHYKTGDTISSFYLSEIKKVVKANKEKLDDEELKEIEKKEPLEQIYDLIDMNSHFSVRDIDWRHAIDYFSTHSDAIKRYYPLFRMKPEFFSAEEDIAKALFLNDEFFDFCKGL